MPTLVTIDPTSGMMVDVPTNTGTQELLTPEIITPIPTSEVVIEPKPLPTGTSTIVEPAIITTPAPTPTPTPTPAPTTTSTTVVLPTLGGFMGSLGGGFGGGGASGGGGGSSDSAVVEVKKPFPYWLIIVGLVGGYLIFKKK